MFINTILPYLASNGNFVFKYYNFNTPEYKAISFKDIKQHVDSKHSYRIMNVSKNLLDNKEAIEAWRNLKENANKDSTDAKKRRQVVDRIKCRDYKFNDEDHEAGN